MLIIINTWQVLDFFSAVAIDGLVGGIIVIIFQTFIHVFRVDFEVLVDDVVLEAGDEVASKAGHFFQIAVVLGAVIVQNICQPFLHVLSVLLQIFHSFLVAEVQFIIKFH